MKLPENLVAASMELPESDCATRFFTVKRKGTRSPPGSCTYGGPSSLDRGELQGLAHKNLPFRWPKSAFFCPRRLHWRADPQKIWIGLTESVCVGGVCVGTVDAA